MSEDGSQHSDEDEPSIKGLPVTMEYKDIDTILMINNTARMIQCAPKFPFYIGSNRKVIEFKVIVDDKKKYLVLSRSHHRINKYSNILEQFDYVWHTDSEVIMGEYAMSLEMRFQDRQHRRDKTPISYKQSQYVVKRVFDHAELVCNGSDTIYRSRLDSGLEDLVGLYLRSTMDEVDYKLVTIKRPVRIENLPPPLLTLYQQLVEQLAITLPAFKCINYDVGDLLLGDHPSGALLVIGD